MTAVPRPRIRALRGHLLGLADSTSGNLAEAFIRGLAFSLASSETILLGLQGHWSQADPCWKEDAEAVNL